MADLYNYVAVKPCGCVGPIISDSGRKDAHVARTVAGWIRDGYRIERMRRADAVDAHLRPCPHERRIGAFGPIPA